LGEILAHVREHHLRPRLRRLGAAVPADVATQAIIAGPADGPPWLQALKEPVPRALREEWQELTRRLRALYEQGSASR